MATIPTLQEIKQGLGITFSSQDVYLLSLRDGVLDDVERFSGIVTKSLDPDEEVIIPAKIKVAIMDQIEFLYSNRGDLNNRRNDSFYHTLRSYTVTSFI